MLKWCAIWIEFALLFFSLAVSAATSDDQAMHSAPMDVDCEARLNTQRFTFQAVPHPEVYGALAGPAIMSSRGELFISMSLGGKTGLYNAEKKYFTAYAESNLHPSSDLFEARSGRVFYSYTTNQDLNVFDARTGKNLISTHLADIPGVGALLAQLAQNSPLYRPLFFETSVEGVQIAIAPRSDEFYLDEAFRVPLATLSLRTGETKTAHLQSGLFTFKRSRNGHVYGLGWERNFGGIANTLVVHDFNSQKTIIRDKFEHTQDPPIMSGPLSLFFVNPRQPELVMHLQSPVGGVSIYDRETRQFRPLPGLSRATTTGIQFFNDKNGKPWFAAVEGSESGSILPEFFRLVIQPMVAINGTVVLDLDLEHPENDISGLDVIERPEGRLFLAWERMMFENRVRYARVHIYDETSRELSIVQIPTSWPGAIRKKTFWDPVRKVLVAYFLRDEGHTPELALLTPTGAGSMTTR